MARLFGFSIEDTEKTPAGVVSPVPPNRQDGSEYYVSSGFYGSYVDIEGVFRNEYDLIKRYREMSLHPECDEAIEDIVNEAIVSDLNDTPVEIDLSNLPAGDNIKKIRLGHDNKGLKSGWYVSEISVVCAKLGKSWRFPVGKWFARDEDDQLIERDLYPDVDDTDTYEAYIPYEAHV